VPPFEHTNGGGPAAAAEEEEYVHGLISVAEATVGENVVSPVRLHDCNTTYTVDVGVV